MALGFYLELFWSDEMKTGPLDIKQKNCVYSVYKDKYKLPKSHVLTYEQAMCGEEKLAAGKAREILSQLYQKIGLHSEHHYTVQLQSPYFATVDLLLDSFLHTASQLHHSTNASLDELAGGDDFYMTTVNHPQE